LIGEIGFSGLIDYKPLSTIHMRHVRIKENSASGYGVYDTMEIQPGAAKNQCRAGSPRLLRGVSLCLVAYVGQENSRAVK
jgi:hypothetical protein